jgi:hypothetical protein
VLGDVSAPLVDASTEQLHEAEVRQLFEQRDGAVAAAVRRYQHLGRTLLVGQLLGVWVVQDDFQAGRLLKQIDADLVVFPWLTSTRSAVLMPSR